VADIFAFSLEDGEFALEDTHFEVVKARRRIRPELVVKAGELIEPGSRAVRLRRLWDCDQELFRYLEETR
jgi:hypothetical protein